MSALWHTLTVEKLSAERGFLKGKILALIFCIFDRFFVGCFWCKIYSLKAEITCFRNLENFEQKDD
jgi:hypothetical protein